MNFPSIRVEGAILSGDVLGKLEAAELPGQRPADFGFDSATRLKDEIVRAWTAAQAYRRAFQHRVEGLKEGATGATETRNLWIIPLLDLLGYSDIEFSRSETVGDRAFPYFSPSSHLRWSPRSHRRRSRVTRQEACQRSRPTLQPARDGAGISQPDGAPLRARH